MTGRDGNRGECAQPCRYRYALQEETRPGEYFPIEEDGRYTYIMNSKDLCLICYMPELIGTGVNSFKIEGRMKSVYYVSAVVKAYRSAIDDYFTDLAVYERKKPFYLEELAKTGHRDFTSAFFTGRQQVEAFIHSKDASESGSKFLGVVKAYDSSNGTALIEQRGKFSEGESVEFLCAQSENFTQTLGTLTDVNGAELKSAPHPRQPVYIKTARPLNELDIMRSN
jgi:putative protease